MMCTFLGLIYFIDDVLLGIDKGIHINIDHLKFVIDLKFFESYPYGKVCYRKNMVSCSLDTRDKKDGDVSKKTKGTNEQNQNEPIVKTCKKLAGQSVFARYTDHGYILAIQYWE